MVSLRTLTLYLPRLSDQTLTISSGGILPDVCGYSPVPVSWHPVHSIVLQILIIHFGFYQPFHQGTSLQGLPLSSSCHIANAIHLIVLGGNIQSESYLDLADFTADHLQTQLMCDELAVDVSQFIKLVSATKEESPSFSFLLCISRFVSPQEFHIDFDFILLWASLLLLGLNTSQHHTRVSEFIETRSKATLSES